jgi:tetratricopeptide (TPR) repeat protein/HEAT repeat protein
MALRRPPLYAHRVRPHLLAALLALTVAAPIVAPRDAHADFDPSGRTKKKPPKPGPGPAKPGPGPAKPGPKKPPKDDEESKAGPGSDALIARYTAIVMAQPSQPFPLQRLGQLYRERDGNLKKLVEDFEKRAAAAGPEQWAARVALAGIYKQDGRYDDAIRTYQQAIADKPKEPSAMLALGQLQADRGDKVAARAQLEAALPLLKPGADVEQTTRTLLGYCLDLKDYEGAKKYHEALVKHSGGSLFVKAELGRELLSRGNYDRAEAEFREVVKAAAGDNRALAPALRDLGQALAKQKKMDEALATLKKALAVAGSAAGVRSEILLIMTDAFRAEGKLAELITLLEAEKPGDFQRLSMMGALYEETGDVDKAISTYRKALGVDAKQIDVRVKLVHLLQTAGDLDTAIKEYESLIKAAPNNPDFVFELCDTLIQRGDRAKALKLVQELEGRAHDPGVLAAVADFYERVEEKDKALKVLQKLASSGVDPAHIIDLGDRYFQAGDKKKALETWARLKTVITNRAKAAATLGEVYLDHDMAAEALQALREAVQLEPANLRYKKALAGALERTATSLGSATMRYAEARAIWEELLAAAGTSDKVLAREARTHIVSLWALTRELPAQVTPLTNRFNATPPDLEAGRLLAEVQRKLHRLPDAEATLRRVVSLAPGDEESLLALERVLVQEQNLGGAIDVLAKLVEVDPKRAREFYQRMAQYAAELYRDDDAITFAARAVELSPHDPSGHQKLGEMYKRRQDVPHAIAEFRKAIAQNDRLFPVYFELAELLRAQGQVDEADRLYRRVVRASPDEELVARAARMSMAVNLGKGTLAELERELLPVAVGNPQKTIYRRLLVELYGAMTFPLVQKLRGNDPRSAAATAARSELAKIGARAVKPLLDALADDKESQQKIAIEVLAYVENKSAGPALYNYATGTADKSLRVRAMIACGALRDPAMLPRYEQMLAPKEGAASLLPSDSIAVAAAWGVARMGDKKAEGLLVRLLASSSPDVRALAAIGLGLTHDKKHAPALATLARSPEAGANARAAATHALAELGERVDPALLLANAGSPDVVLRQAALLAMARLGAKDDASKTTGPAEAIAAGVFSPDESLRGAAEGAGAALAMRNYRRTREALPVPDGPLTLREVLAGLAPDTYSASDRAAALVALAPALRKAAVAAVSTSPERARVVADALLAGSTKFTLLPFVSASDKLDPKLAAQADEAIESIAQAVVPGFVALERHPAVDVRTRAVELLARRPEPEAQAAVVDALGDPDESVRRAALSSVGPVKSDKLVTAISAIVKESPSWPLRVRAAEALGRLGAGSPGNAAVTMGPQAAPNPAPPWAAQIVSTLSAAAKGDVYALVREAAARALVPVDPAAAKPLLEELAAKDAEPRVRETAKELLAEKR